jgi:hypothetical protein
MLYMTFKLWGLATLLLVQAAPAQGQELAPDVAARRAEAKRELGERAQVEAVEGVFVLITPHGQRALSNARAVAKQAIDAYFNGRFAKRPQQAVSVYLFAEERTYEAYCQKRWGKPCISPFGFYRPDERRIVMNIGPGIGTLTHELVHPIVETDFPDAPQWLNEGLASLYEGFSIPGPGEIRGVKNWRHARLVKALRSKGERDKAGLPALFALSDQAFRGPDEALNYATARYLCQWLEQQGKLWTFYQDYRDHYAADPSGAAAFTRATGKTLGEANADWSRWVQRL